MNIPLTKPLLAGEEEAAVISVLRSGWLVQGANVNAFEDAVAKYVDSAYAVAVSSCTTALHLALVVGGISEGDEVLVPAFTHTASANVVEYQRAKPVFVDIDLHTFNMNIGGVEKVITDNTKAIMPVHMFGLCVEMDLILSLARTHDLFVVEDAACGLGSLYKSSISGQAFHAGAMGTMGCFSFHPRKIITTGEGGMLVTNSVRVADAARSLRAFGMSASAYERRKVEATAAPDFGALGYNYRMTDIQGAMGVVQMQRLDGIVLKRHSLAARYNEAFGDISGLQVPIEAISGSHTYQSYVLLVTEAFPLSRDEVAQKLRERGIATRPGGKVVPMLPYYCKKYGYTLQDFPSAVAAERCSLTMPLYPQMTIEEQDYVINAVRELV